MPVATVEKRTLRTVLDLVGTAVPKKSGMPILAGVLLDCDGTQMRIRGTDLDVEAEVSVPLTRATEPFSLCLPVKSLADCVKRAKGSIIQIAPTADHGADIVSDAATVHVGGFDPEQFPPSITARAGDNDWVYGEMDVRAFTEAFTRVAVAAAADRNPARPILTAVDCRDGRLLACDGIRVASQLCGFNTEHSLAIPSAFGKLLAKAAMDDAARTRYQVVGSGEDMRAAYFEVAKGPIRLSCRLVEGRYPAVEDLLPKTYGTVAHMELADFTAAMEAGATVAGRERLYTVALTVLPDRCVMVAKGEDGQEFRTEIPASLAGQPIAIAFDGRNLVEMLRKFHGHRLTIGFSGVQFAARFTCELDSLTCWQMPIRCDWVEQPHAEDDAHQDAEVTSPAAEPEVMTQQDDDEGDPRPDDDLPEWDAEPEQEPEPEPQAQVAVDPIEALLEELGAAAQRTDEALARLAAIVEEGVNLIRRVAATAPALTTSPAGDLTAWAPRAARRVALAEQVRAATSAAVAAMTREAATGLAECGGWIAAFWADWAADAKAWWRAVRPWFGGTGRHGRRNRRTPTEAASVMATD